MTYKAELMPNEPQALEEEIGISKQSLLIGPG